MASTLTAKDRAAAREAKNQAEIERLRATNATYRAYINEWKLYLASYEGGPSFANSENIFRHVRENEADYRDRVRRAHYLNYCAPLVDFFTNFIFTDTIQRDGGSVKEFYTEFIKDVDRRGATVDKFMRAVSDDAQIFGLVYILVDAPVLPEGRAATKMDEVAGGLRPYWVLVLPDEILDWAVDELGQLVYAKRKQLVRRFDGDIAVYEKYTEWTAAEVRVSWVDVTSEAKPQLGRQETLVNPVGVVPLVPALFKESKEHPEMGNSFLRDLAYNSREVMNLTSLLQEFLYRQCFNMLAKETDTSVPLEGQSTGDAGTSNVVEYPRGGKAPEYISPPADPAQFIQSERENIINQMYALASRDLMSEVVNGQKSSGFSQAQGFSRTVPFIASRADNLELAENRLMALTMKFKSAEWSGKVKYKDHYEITNVMDAITQLTSVFRDLGMPSETFAKQELKRLVHELDGKIPAEDMAKIMAEIDAMDFKEWRQIQVQALVGRRRGSSPAEQNKTKQTGTMEEVVSEGAKNQQQPATKKLKS